MIRRTAFLLALIGLALVHLAPPTPFGVMSAQARPHHRARRKAATPRRTRVAAARRQRSAGVAARTYLPPGDALWDTGGGLANPPAASDAQALVNTGHLPPFYNPQDLSQPPVLDVPSAILIDADTGQTLWAKNPTQRRYPASTTKILTSLIFIEHTQPTDIVTCTDPNITHVEPSSLNIKPWEKFSAQDLLYGTLLRSGNDGAVVMAEHVAGSTTHFAQLMNARAAELGATDSHWVTPNGLHDPAHYTTVRDMARIARAAMDNPRFADAVSQPERTINRTINLHDSVIVTKARKYWDRFPGADGVKTGYTHQAGHCFVGSATRDGHRLIAVAFDARRSAVDDIVPLLSWGFARWGTTPVARRGDPEPAVAVVGGATATVPTTAAADLRIATDSLRTGAPLPIETTAAPNPGLRAPIRRGETVGTLTVTRNGRTIGSVPLLAAAEVSASVFPAGDGMTRLMLRSLPVVGGLTMLLVAWRWHATTTSKSARRRRRGLATYRRGDDRRR